MKKFVQISVLVLLVFAVAVTAFAAARTSSTLAGGSICPNVGWNTRVTGCLAGTLSPDLHELAYQVVPKPTVGWNS